MWLFGDHRFAIIVGMEGIDCDRAVDLSKYIDTSQYTIYQGVHARMTSQYFYASRKKKTKTSIAARSTVVENPNPGCWLTFCKEFAFLNHVMCFWVNVFVLFTSEQCYSLVVLLVCENFGWWHLNLRWIVTVTVVKHLHSTASWEIIHWHCLCKSK